MVRSVALGPALGPKTSTEIASSTKLVTGNATTLAQAAAQAAVAIWSPPQPSHLPEIGICVVIAAPDLKAMWVACTACAESPMANTMESVKANRRHEIPDHMTAKYQFPGAPASARRAHEGVFLTFQMLDEDEGCRDRARLEEPEQPETDG
jgi:hypothetical protein